MTFSLRTIPMAPSTPPTKAAEPRPGPLRSSRSFPRHGAQEVIDPLTRSQRANTIQNDGTPEITVQHTSPQKHGAGSGAHDAFETDDADDGVEPPRASVDLDDIPIELVSLTDKYAEQQSRPPLWSCARNRTLTYTQLHRLPTGQGPSHTTQYR